jgi:hypothetical protein
MIDKKNLNFSDKTKLPYEYPKLEIILDSLNWWKKNGRQARAWANTNVIWRDIKLLSRLKQISYFFSFI